MQRRNAGFRLQELAHVCNDAPLVVLDTSEALTWGQKQTNGHLLALTYKRRSIYVNNSHGILEGSEIDPEEYREPFMQKLPKHRRFGPGVSMPGAMKLSRMGLVKMSDPLVHCMRIDEKELMAWTGCIVGVKLR